MTVKHATFTLERNYPAPVPEVFAAWADPAAKARWFAGGGEHQLDFRIGGREVNQARHLDGSLMTFGSHYQDIVPDERIVYSSTLSADGIVSTASLTTVQFESKGTGTLLLLVEQGTFLDGHEQPQWREQGTADWLDRLGLDLAAAKNA